MRGRAHADHGFAFSALQAFGPSPASQIFALLPLFLADDYSHIAAAFLLVFVVHQLAVRFRNLHLERILFQVATDGIATSRMRRSSISCL